jgi:hypothetical protein
LFKNHLEEEKKPAGAGREEPGFRCVIITSKGDFLL